ncbi:MAG: hypothetical protein ACFCUR_03175 [Rhodomicrobiaceae bacterium]
MAGLSRGMETMVSEQSVIVTFYKFAEKFWTEDKQTLDPLFELEDDLEGILAGRELGELDGHEIAVDGSDGFLFLYGPDADALYSAIEPVLRASPVTQGGNATLRYGAYGQHNVRERYIEIKPHVH